MIGCSVVTQVIPRDLCSTQDAGHCYFVFFSIRVYYQILNTVPYAKE